MKTFLNSNLPIVTGMLRATTKDEILAEIARIRADGAEAYGFQMERMVGESKSEESLREIFAAMSDKPVYLTNYLRSNSTEGITWDTIAQQMLCAVKMGATLVDIPAEMFAPMADMELTTDVNAVERQKKLIEDIHALGGEVLMSSHVFRYIPREAVMTIARAHRDRGADISKIVTDASSEEELNENFTISCMLERELGIKHLFLCNGTHCKKHRRIAPILGSCMFLATENALTGQNQPTVAEARFAISFAEKGLEK